MKKSLTWRQRAAIAAASAIGLSLAVAPAADAKPIVSIDVSGDSSWSVTARAEFSSDSTKVGQTSAGTATITFKAYVLGIPVNNTGYYANSIPTSFNKPSLVSANYALYSRTYAKKSNRYLGVQQWEVSGSRKFTGDMKVSIKGDAKAASASSSKYFYAGTYECGSGCTNADAIVRAKTVA